MKRLIIIIVAVLAQVQLFGSNEPKWKLSTKDWETYSYYHYISRIATFRSDIKIQLLGDYTPGDSIKVKGIIDGVTPLIPREKIYFVKSGGNLRIKIESNTDTSNRGTFSEEVRYLQDKSKADVLKSIMSDFKLSVLLPNYYGISYTETPTNLNTKNQEIAIFFKVHSDCPQWIRDKMIESFILNSMVKPYAGSSYSFSFNYYLGNKSPITADFQEVEKFIIYHSYLNTSELIHFLTKHTKFFSR